MAASEGHQEVVKYLLSIGADPWQADKFGLTALHHAARHGRVAVIHELLTDTPPASSLACRIVNPTTKYIDAMDLVGWTALHYAVYKQHQEAAATLLSYDANLIARTLVYHPVITSLPPGSSPLHIASAQGNLPMIQMLLRAYYETSADLLPNQLATIERRRRQRSQPDPRLILSRTGRLAFHIALRYGQTEVLEWLDPSIPLMFLLSGSDDANAGGGSGGGGGSVTGFAGVPRLTVLAANALHAALLSDLSTVEQELKVKERQKEQAKADLNTSLAQKAHGAFTALISRVVTGAGRPSREGNDDGSNLPSIPSRPASRPTSRRNSRTRFGGRTLQAPQPQRRLVFQESARITGSGPAAAARASQSRLVQILAASVNFQRQSDYEDQNMRMGIAIPPNPVHNPVATFRRTNTMEGAQNALAVVPVVTVEAEGGRITMSGGQVAGLMLGGNVGGPAEGTATATAAATATTRPLEELPAPDVGTPRARHSDPGSVQRIRRALADAVAADEARQSSRLPSRDIPDAGGGGGGDGPGPSSSGGRGSRGSASEQQQQQPSNLSKVSIVGFVPSRGSTAAYIGASGLSRSTERYSEPGLSAFSFGAALGLEGDDDVAMGVGSVDEGRAATPSMGLRVGHGQAAPGAPDASKGEAAASGEEPAWLRRCESAGMEEASSSGAAAVAARRSPRTSPASQREPALQLPGAVEDEGLAEAGAAPSDRSGRDAAVPALELPQSVFFDAGVAEDGASSARWGLKAGGGASTRSGLTSVAETSGSGGVGGPEGDSVDEGDAALGDGEDVLRGSSNGTSKFRITTAAPASGGDAAEVADGGGGEEPATPTAVGPAGGAGTPAAAPAAADGERSGGLLSTITKHLKKMSTQVVPVALRGGASKASDAADGSAPRSKSLTAAAAAGGGANGGSDAESDDGASLTDQAVVGAEGTAEDMEDDVCCVCLDEVPNVQLMRCKHRLCLGCAKDLCNRYSLTPALCPYCRSIISGFCLADAAASQKRG